MTVLGCSDKDLQQQAKKLHAGLLSISADIMQLAGRSQFSAPGPSACRQSALPYCQQPGNAAAARCSPDTRCLHSTPPSGCGAPRTARTQAAARRDPETAAQQDLWSEDLANTSWGEAWAPSEDSQREEPPQIWPEPEVCCRHCKNVLQNSTDVPPLAASQQLRYGG